MEEANSNDSYEVEEEDVLIYVEFEEFSKQSADNNCKTFKIIGLDTNKPILQMGNNFYEGEYANSFGTHTFFDEDERPNHSIKPVTKTDVKKLYKFVDKTDKKLRMKRIFIREKNLEEQSNQDEKLCKLPETYEKALQELVHMAETEQLVQKPSTD